MFIHKRNSMYSGSNKPPPRSLLGSYQGERYRSSAARDHSVCFPADGSRLGLPMPHLPRGFTRRSTFSLEELDNHRPAPLWAPSFDHRITWVSRPEVTPSAGEQSLSRPARRALGQGPARRLLPQARRTHVFSLPWKNAGEVSALFSPVTGRGGGVLHHQGLTSVCCRRGPARLRKTEKKARALENQMKEESVSFPFLSFF